MGCTCGLGRGGWLGGENRSRSREKAEGATPPPSPSPLPATIAAAPPLLRRPRIEVLLFHLASPSPPHHPFLFLNGSLAPFLHLLPIKVRLLKFWFACENFWLGSVEIKLIKLVIDKAGPWKSGGLIRSHRFLVFCYSWLYSFFSKIV